MNCWRGSGIDATVRDIERQAAAQRREREEVARATARAAEHAREDREAQRARARAIFNAAPERREDVALAFDRAIAEREIERMHDSERQPAGSLDAGRGAGNGAPAAPWTPTWAHPTGLHRNT